MKVLFFALLCVVACSAISPRSSHSEAPGTAKIPNADITDLYAFKSYETGKTDYVVFLMNTIPLQNPNAGPNYYAPSDRHFFELNIDNTGDCVEDIIIQWYNGNSLGGEIANITEVDDNPCGNYSLINVEAHEGIKLPVGNPGANDSDIHNVAVALKLVGIINSFQVDDPALNWREWYQMRIIHGDRQTGVPEDITDAADGATRFNKPFDYTGTKGFPSYETYSKSTDFIRELDIPGCTPSSGIAGRVFVGQRKESFSIALGKVFDLINFVPVAPGTFNAPNANVGVADCDEHNELAGKNVLTYALEIHQECVQGNASDVIGVWGTTRELTHVGSEHIAGQQVSRLGNPLVNELVIGLNDKAKFNIGHPTGDGQFLDYVLYPTMPEIIDLLFLTDVNALLGGAGLLTLAPNVPRQDLFITFLTGVPTLNENGGTCEYQRLNLSVPALPASGQNNMGVIGLDNAGYPNGRRPGDDVVDITLRVVMGRLCTLSIGCNATDAPLGGVDFTDGSPQRAAQFDSTFPFLTTPNPGSVDYTSPSVCIGSSSSTDGGDGTDGTVGDGCSSSASSIASWISFF